MLSLNDAQSIVAASLAHGRELSLQPISVAVLDAGGQLIAFAREDGSSNLRPQIAMGKANGALALGVSSRTIGDMAIERAAFVGAVGALVTGGMVPAAGGVLIRDDEGIVIGGVGVTGDTSDNDELCALHGIKSAGLRVG